MSESVRVAVCLGTSWVAGREVLRGVYHFGEPLGWSVTPVHEQDISKVLGWSPHVLIVNDLNWAQLQDKRICSTVVVGIEVALAGDKRAGVHIDNEAVGAEAAAHLVSLGLRHLVGFGISGHSWWDERYQGFRRAAEKAGCTVEQFDIEGKPPTTNAPPHPFDEVQPWLRSVPRPFGVFSGCDSWGRLIILEARAAGLRVPEDVAVISADNDDLFCELTRPRLSSVIIPWAPLGMVAGRVAEQLLEGQPVTPPERLKPPGVAVRRSTELLVVKDPDIHAALTVIREHKDRRCTVRDILKHVPASRHRLERGFRKELGRTMTEEIRRVHVDQAKRLLATTDMLLADVAARAGFASSNKMGIAFRKEMSLSPSEYRAKFRGHVQS